MSQNILDSLLKILSPTTPAAPDYGYTANSTVAPPAWQEMMAKQPGFNPLGSGGGDLIGDWASWGSGGPAATNSPSFMGGLLGYEGKNGYVPGWGGMALSAASGIGQSLMSMKQYGLMKDQLKEQKRQFDINYAMQKKAFNSQVEDRQRARVASNPGAYESVTDYMKKYGA